MHYLIDGYNLLHAVGRLQGGRSANVEFARTDLFRLLHARFGKQSDKITLVFDAQGAPPSVRDHQKYEGIDVHFTRNEEADDLIEDLIRRAAVPGDVTVVSNDHRLRQAARRRRCAIEECVEFWASLTEPPKQKALPAQEPERPTMSREDIEGWMKEFGDLEHDPRNRDLFDPDFGE